MVSAVTIMMLGAMLQTLFGGGVLPLTATTAANIPWSTVIPALDAVAVAVVLYSATPDLEATAARNLGRYRFLCAAAAFVTAAALTYVSAFHVVQFGYGPAAAVRNLLGFTGLALASTKIGRTYFWLPTFAYTSLCVSAGVSRGIVANWAFPIQPDRSVTAWMIALPLLLIGVIAARSGGRFDSSAGDE